MNNTSLMQDDRVTNRPVLSNNGKGYPSISYSEINTFNTCRMRHHYVYNRKLEKQVFDPKPALGSMGHAALEAYYAGAEWSQHLIKFVHHEVARQEMFDETQQLYWQMAQLVEGIVARYVEHHASEDKKFKVRSVEQKFEAVLPRTGRALAGFWDALVEDERGRWWIRDYKFVGGRIETDDSGKMRFKPGGSFRQEWELELDLQLALYHWAGLKLGLPIFGTVYDQLKAAVPKTPELLKSGKALSKARITTDWPTYLAAIEAHGFDPEDYIDVMGWATQTEYFRRIYVTRTPEEIENVIADTILKVREIKRAPAPTMTPIRMNCSGCSFKELCLEFLRGRDLTPMIEYSYQPRSRRADHLLLEDDSEDYGEEDDLF